MNIYTEAALIATTVTLTFLVLTMGAVICLGLTLASPEYVIDGKPIPHIYEYLGLLLGLLDRFLWFFSVLVFLSSGVGALLMQV